VQLISPVDNLAEASSLLEAGADELYGGFIPLQWQDYGLAASLNQRTFAAAQIGSEEELVGIIALAKQANKRFALTLNAPYYTEEQMPLLLEYVDAMVALGVDSLILADLGLLRCLSQRLPTLEYHASTLAHLGNSGAVRFYAAQGMQRVILPRHLSVADMAAIVKAAPQVRCDAFLLVGKCPNTEGLCTFHHAAADRIWPCEIPYQIDPLAGEASPALVAAMQKQQSWATTDRRHGCGLCAIPHLLQAGIYGLKLVGRGAPMGQKVKNLQLAKEFLLLAEKAPDFDQYRHQAMAAHRKHFGSACHQNVCYYPEFLN